MDGDEQDRQRQCSLGAWSLVRGNNKYCDRFYKGNTKCDVMGGWRGAKFRQRSQLCVGLCLHWGQREKQEPDHDEYKSW